MVVKMVKAVTEGEEKAVEVRAVVVKAVEETEAGGAGAAETEVAVMVEEAREEGRGGWRRGGRLWRWRWRRWHRRRR